METATLICLFVLAGISMAACQTTPISSIATADDGTAPPDTDVPATITRKNTWVDFTLDSVSLRIQVPDGWEGDTTDEGIVLAEHIGTMESGGVLDSVQVHCFVHPVEGIATPDGSNRAWAILTKIVNDREYVGADDRVSAPEGFTWDHYDAAYYLLNNGDGSLKLVLALAVSEGELVACSISAPYRLAARIRLSAPIVLSSLTVNGHRLDGSSLHGLPDPLEFPDYYPEMTAEAP